MAEVVLQEVSRRYGATLALDRLSMTIADGAFVVLLGPTGAGKTTTLRLISGLEAPDGGDILMGGRSVLRDSPAQRDVAMVFQQYSLYGRAKGAQRRYSGSSRWATRPACICG